MTLYRFPIYSQIESKIEEAKQQIVQYKEELQKARVIRRHRQEYDALAKVILWGCMRRLGGGGGRRGGGGSRVGEHRCGAVRSLLIVLS